MNAASHREGDVHMRCVLAALMSLVLYGCQSAAPSPPAAPASVAACSVAGLPTPGPDNVVLTAANSSGVVAGATIILQPGTTIAMTGDLTLVASSAITIEGTITMPTKQGATLTLVSLGSSVNITSSASIGNGSATGGQSGDNGQGGQGAGAIRIAAPKGDITVNGTITGQAG